MFKTSQETESQAVQEAAKGQVRADTMVILLERYYAANETQQKRLKAEILKYSDDFIKNVIRQRLRVEPWLRAEFDDLCQEVLIKIANELSEGKRIRAFFAWLRAVISNTIRENRCKHSPWRMMNLRVRYITEKSVKKHLFARWQAFNSWLVGLRSQQKIQTDIKTAHYLAFCQDAAPFVQKGLQGHDPADKDLKLWKLMAIFLAWIEMPLEQPNLVRHLLDLRDIKPFIEISLSDSTNDLKEPSTETAAREIVLDWERCWAEVRLLRPRTQATLLLSLKPEVRKTLLAQTDPGPHLVSLLKQAGITKDLSKEIGTALKKSEVTDEEIASILGTNVVNIHTMRSRYRDHLEQRLGRSIFL